MKEDSAPKVRPMRYTKGYYTHFLRLLSKCENEKDELFSGEAHAHQLKKWKFLMVKVLLQSEGLRHTSPEQRSGLGELLTHAA